MDTERIRLDLVNLLARKADISKTAARRIVNSNRALLEEQFVQGGTITLNPAGSIVQNVHTGSEGVRIDAGRVEIASYRPVLFSPERHQPFLIEIAFGGLPGGIQITLTSDKDEEYKHPSEDLPGSIQTVPISDPEQPDEPTSEPDITLPPDPNPQVD